MLGEAMLGLLSLPNSAPVELARKQCLPLPGDPDRFQGPHGGSLLSTRCEVVGFGPLEGGPQPRWMTARYSWTSVFSAEDGTRGAAARHHRRRGSRAVRGKPAREGILLSIMNCVNGTGGCGHEFLHLHSDGRSRCGRCGSNRCRAGSPGRMAHGVRIDPRTLRGEAGF